jgi:phage tail-like protein
MTAVERAFVLEGGAWTDPERSVRDATLEVEPTADAALTLGALPGRARSVEDPARVTERWIWPVAIAGDPSTGLFLADAGAQIIRRASLDASASRIVRSITIPTIGGKGHGLRRITQPRSVAILRNGAIAIADAGRHRVQLFSARPYALLHVWGKTDALGRPAPGSGALEFREPSAIAVGGDQTLYVADRGNARVQRIRSDGVPLEPLGEGVLHAPDRLAVGPDDAVAVLDRAHESVWIFTRRRVLPQLITGPVAPTSVTFAPDGRLYVGDANGGMHVFVPGAGAAEPWQPAGSGVAGFDGAIEDLLWWPAASPRLLLLAVNAATRERPRLWTVDPRGGRALAGALVTGPLDSAIERCQWHRTRVEADVPAGCSIEIESFTAASNAVDPKPTDEDFNAWTSCVLAGDENPDCLIQSEPGRYLWLRINVRSNGRQAPAIRRIRITYPRSSYLEYLPAVYQEDEESRQFLERFLAIFKSGFDDFDDRIDGLHEIVDPHLTPARYLLWLAGWVALPRDPHWPEAHLREQIAGAIIRYRRRGTPDGLVEAIRAYTGAEATILEHFRLRRWIHLTAGETGIDPAGAPLWSRDVFQRLQLSTYSQIGRFRLTGLPEPAAEPYEWGANRFSVLVVSSPYDVEAIQGRVRDVVEREKPAHTEATICPVLPRFRVGVQARVGMDTAVGAVSHLVLNRLATLGYDTILACSQEERTLRALGSGVRPVVGSTTRVP